MFVKIVIFSLAVAAVSSSEASSAVKTSTKQKHLLDRKIQNQYDAIDISEAPYQVSLQQGSGHFCGGTVLSNKYILTAARCVYGISPENTITVHAGSSDLSIDNQVARAVQINIHPDYDPANHAFDVAILQINPLLTLGSLNKVEAANLREPENNVTGVISVTVTGWGTTSGVKPGLLQSSTFTLLGWDDNCESIYGNHIGAWLCASTCVGNAGDPLKGNDGSIAGYIAGIVSYEPEECGNYNAYIYTWIEGSTIRNFITDVTGL